MVLKSMSIFVTKVLFVLKLKYKNVYLKLRVNSDFIIGSEMK